MKGFYLLLSPLFKNRDSGVLSKIQAQIKALNDAGLETEMLACHYSAISYFEKIKKRFSRSSFIENIPNAFFFGDFYYFRHSAHNIIPILGLVKKIKQCGKGKIIIEIPTYPYYDEFGKNILSRIKLLPDKIFTGQLKKYVDRIVTYSKDKVIFDIQTIQAKNGVDISTIPISIKIDYELRSINLVVVANYNKWHGYDRIIEGMREYYEQEKTVKVYLHFIGDGSALKSYRDLVEQYKLSEYVVFYGVLLEEELTNVYNKANIAINSLGSHRINIYLTSALKSKEYLARGIPIVSSTKIDVIPDGFRYCLYVPENDSPVDIEKIVRYYTDLLARKDINDISQDIRQFAEDHCDISTTMLPIINYICQGSEYNGRG